MISAASASANSASSRAIAEDVVQDCYTNAWKHREQLRDPELFRCWLGRPAEDAEAFVVAVCGFG